MHDKENQPKWFIDFLEYASIHPLESIDPNKTYSNIKTALKKHKALQPNQPRPMLYPKFQIFQRN